ncbi:hypothetical protein DPV78_011324 [Talaromyces pinophilus]|nr:hypothetical protein DPV78_011324 [Talaromyces pinophilus]
MRQGSTSVKSQIMPQISDSFTGKQRGMKRDTTRTSPARHSTSASDPESKNRTHARRRIQLAV